MDTMDSKRKIGAICVALLALAMVTCAFSANVVAEDYTEDDEEYEKELVSTYITTAPTLDGSLEDWNMVETTHSSFWFVPESLHMEGLIWTAFANDENWLYIAVDLTPDNTSEDEDFIFVGVDNDNSGSYDEENDTMFYLYGDGESMALGGITAVGGYEKTEQADWKHRVWEIAINLDSIGKEANDTVRMVLFGYGTLAPEWYYPAENKEGGNFPYDVINAKITIADAPPAEPPAVAGTPTNVLYTVYIEIIAILVVLVMMLAYERIWNAANEYYSKGKYWSAVLLTYGIPLLLQALATLQYYFDWVGWIL